MVQQIVHCLIRSFILTKDNIHKIREGNSRKKTCWVYRVILFHSSVASTLIIILPLPYRRLAILDGVHGTMVVTAHAHRAVAIPLGATIFQSDVL